MLRKLWPLVPISAIALVLWLIFPFGFPTYDTAYALLWGDQLAHGQSPDYGDLVDSFDFRPRCVPISVPNYRAVPSLATWLDRRPSQIVSTSEHRQPRHGYLVGPRSQFVVHNFLLDPGDDARLRVEIPHGFSVVGLNESWKLYVRCG